MEAPPSPLSSRPKWRDLQFTQPASDFGSKLRPPLCHLDRTRLSYYAAPPMTMYAPFIEDSRMKFARRQQALLKSGEVEGSAVDNVGGQLGRNKPVSCPVGQQRRRMTLRKPHGVRQRHQPRQETGVPGTMMISFQCFSRQSQPYLLSQQKQLWGFARLCPPTYAGTNVGYPAVTKRLLLGSPRLFEPRDQKRPNSTSQEKANSF
jgi:hypothetical protein